MRFFDSTCAARGTPEAPVCLFDVTGENAGAISPCGHCGKN